MVWSNGQSGPWQGATMGADQWALMVNSWFPDGVVGDPTTNDLKVYGDSTGMHAKIRVGTAKLVGQWANATSESIVTIGPNGGGQPRVDRVVLRRDPVAASIDPFVIAGSPGATPVPPSLTAQDLPLALVAVAAGAVTIAGGNVTDDRVFFPLPKLVALDPSHLPASPRLGQVVWVTSLNQDQVWNGTVWAARSVSANTAVTPDVNGNASITHPLGVLPSSVQLTLDVPAGGSLAAATVGLRASSSTALSVRIFRPDGTPFSGSLVTVNWTVFP